MNFWHSLYKYLSFKLFLRIIRLVNESNALNLSWFEFHFPNEKIHKIIVLYKEETNKVILDKF